MVLNIISHHRILPRSYFKIAMQMRLTSLFQCKTNNTSKNKHNAPIWPQCTYDPPHWLKSSIKYFISQTPPTFKNRLLTALLVLNHTTKIMEKALLPKIMIKFVYETAQKVFFVDIRQFHTPPKEMHSHNCFSIPLKISQYL